jgi:ribosomal protein S27AE
MGKKHKKKIYNTPKKIKHVHKNEPLNILKSINNPKCANCSNNMANHDDRLTCSHCNKSTLL